MNRHLYSHLTDFKVGMDMIPNYNCNNTMFTSYIVIFQYLLNSLLKLSTPFPTNLFLPI